MPLEFELTTAPAVHVVFGIVLLGMVLLPRLLHRRPLSFPVIYVAGGFALASLPIDLPHVDPLDTPSGAVHLTEIGVIVAIFGVGLRLRRPVSLRSWAPTWRLLGIAMPLTIAGGAVLAAWWLGFGAAAAVLFGAVLAPTDPVLASDVQRDSPDDDEHGDVQFALTSEAGLNDALAFPFTMLAIVLAEKGTAPGDWLAGWLTVDVGYRLVVGLLGGLVAGWLLSRLVFRIPVGDMPLAETGEGLVALVGTFLAYGVTELAEGYGFLAVFVAAQVLRRAELGHDYHEVVHDFAEQVERLVNGVILVLLGAAIADGLLGEVTWSMVAVAAAMLLVVRPLAAVLALGGVSDHRWITAFFGIRGVGSLFYLSYALEGHDFGIHPELWSAVAIAVVCSIVVHGLLAGPAMQHYERADPGDDGETVEDDEADGAVSARR